MDTRDISILTQVAFKGAIEVCRDGIGSDQGNLAFIETLTFLADALTQEVATRTGSAAPAPAAVAAAVAEVFPNATPVAQATAQPDGDVEIIRTKDGAPFGDTPAWLISAAKAKGVTKVFDNRNRLAQNPKLPWFKSPADQGEVAFWPPKGVANA